MIKKSTKRLEYQGVRFFFFFWEADLNLKKKVKKLTRCIIGKIFYVINLWKRKKVV